MRVVHRVLRQNIWKLLGMNGEAPRAQRPNQLRCPPANQGLAGHASSLETRTTERVKSPLLFVYVPRCIRHLGRKSYTIAVRETKPTNGQSFLFEFLE
jgi:hypothetical protein